MIHNKASNSLFSKPIDREERTYKEKLFQALRIDAFLRCENIYVKHKTSFFTI